MHRTGKARCMAISTAPRPIPLIGGLGTHPAPDPRSGECDAQKHAVVSHCDREGGGWHGGLPPQRQDHRAQLRALRDRCRSLPRRRAHLRQAHRHRARLLAQARRRAQRGAAAARRARALPRPLRALERGRGVRAPLELPARPRVQRRAAARARPRRAVGARAILGRARAGVARHVRRRVHARPRRRQPPRPHHVHHARGRTRRVRGEEPRLETTRPCWSTCESRGSATRTRRSRDTTSASARPSASAPTSTAAATRRAGSTASRRCTRGRPCARSSRASGSAAPPRAASTRP